MTATEELRQMLDERGVKWEAPASYDGSNRFDTVVGDNWFHEYDRGITVHCLTPEQAVEATLGPGTCHMTEHNDLQPEGWYIHYWECSECGNHYRDKFPSNFCPNCGRKVVDG